MLDTIVAVDLVLKQPPNVPSYRTQLHEIIGEGSLSRQNLKLLDTGDWDGEWHTLHVENMIDSMDAASNRRNYRLSLSVSANGKGGSPQKGKPLQEWEVLQMVKPMLLVYTNDFNLSSENLGTRSPPAVGRNNMAMENVRAKETHVKQRSIRSRRSVTGAQQPEPAQSMSEPSLDELASRPCQRNVRTLSFAELGWPGNEEVVIAPSIAQFSFCHGGCNRANDPRYADQYTNHAKILSITKSDLLAAGILPCCVPVEYNPIEVTYRNIYTDIVTMTTLPDISSCQCM